MSAACAVEINPLITHYCISLIRRDTISYPRLFTPQHVGAHAHPHPHPCRTFHCCSHASQMKAILHSVGAARNERLPFIHSGKVGARKGGRLVRKEMSCCRVMTTLVREHLRQHQRASNYNQFPAAKCVLKRAVEQTRLSAERPAAEVTAAGRAVLFRRPRY